MNEAGGDKFLHGPEFAKTVAAMRDIEKQNFAVLHGWRILRFATQHVTGDPEGVIAQIRTVLEGKVQS